MRTDEVNKCSPKTAECQRNREGKRRRREHPFAKILTNRTNVRRKRSNLGDQTGGWDMLINRRAAHVRHRRSNSARAMLNPQFDLCCNPRNTFRASKSSQEPAKTKRSHRAHPKTPPAPRHRHFLHSANTFFDETKPPFRLLRT